ncbi:hexitol phosphatase HxpB [Danxiaibacter flavus]|uniref:Hexitol phosphatase HxpB n=1 Tax=Danxiaibacter flavus TaxID=3049108 RepID=A0ABV3ZMT6_9BACT|nr:hexitol phosphatase HxpB [Chitinophagaceae bacterium DXS]
MIIKKAVIFDMDGVLVDSEKFWKQAEFEVFSSLEVNVTDEWCDETKSMTTPEVTKFWFEKFPWTGKKLEEVERMVVSKVISLIENENCQIPGVKAFIETLKAQNFKIGLATNSPSVVIPAVLNKLGIHHLFDAVSSAEFEPKGKPDPSIYYTTAGKLNVKPEECFVIEDSYSGMLAAKHAGMTVIAFTNGNAQLNFEIADHRIENFEDAHLNILDKAFIYPLN